MWVVSRDKISLKPLSGATMNHYLWAMSLSVVINFSAMAMMESNPSGVFIAPWAPMVHIKEHVRKRPTLEEKRMDKSVKKELSKFVAIEQAARMKSTLFPLCGKSDLAISDKIYFDRAVKNKYINEVIETLHMNKALVTNYRPARLLYAVLNNKADGIFIRPQDTQTIPRDAFEIVALALAEKGGNTGFVITYLMKDIPGIEREFDDQDDDVVRYDDEEDF